MVNFEVAPDIFIEGLDSNPVLSSPNSCFGVQFYQTRESLEDVEVYKRFLDNGISRFRKSKTYTHYKHYLMELGMDRCHIHSNLDSEMCKLEMHHNMLTIFDIALIITEHILNTKGFITTFDLVEALREEHTNNRVQLVMLAKTPHQLYHDSQEFFIHPDMCFGNWVEFLKRYYSGITQDIAFKILFYMKRALDEGSTNDNQLLEVHQNITSWCQYNNFL